MHLPLATVLFLASCALAGAQRVSPDTVIARSMSGQFVVFGARQASPAPAPPGLATNLNYLELQPSLLVISCERIKQALYRELGASGNWSGKMYLVLQPVFGGDDPITIVSQRSREGWNYRVELPCWVERRRYVRAMVQSLLMEFANRQATDRTAEIPVWLTEGLTEILLASGEAQFILAPPSAGGGGLNVRPVFVEARQQDTLESVRKALRGRPPLTVEELSWPTEERLAGEAGEVYRRSAQLFVTELLRLKPGREALRQMVGELAQFYNWQTAFFRAFQPQFTRQLDLEKWWALQCIHFTGHDASQLWTLEESWRRLDEIVRAPAEVRRTVSELPARAPVTLQAIIRQWDQIQQTPVLQARVRDLEIMRLRAAPEIVGLIDDYRQVLSGYLRRRDQVGLLLTAATRDANTNLKMLLRDTVRQLDALDARRQELKPRPAPAPAVASPEPPPSES